MKKTNTVLLVAILIGILFTACGGGGGGSSSGDSTNTPTYTVTFNGNGNTGGSVPIDSINYEQGKTVTMPGNTGNLVKTGYAFAGWNTQADGSGTTYAQAQTCTMGAANITLYAKWTTNPTYTVTYNGNSNTGGSVPVDSTNYEQGQTVTVLGNTGNLMNTNYSFAGWNTLSNGTGTTYTQTQTFTMGTANITLYAKWTANGGVSGVAASGTAIANALVTIVDSNGNTASGTTSADGFYSISSAGLTPPFMLKVASGNNSLYSVQADTNATTTINITPITDIIIRSWYSVKGTTVDVAFSNPATTPLPSPSQVMVISNVVQSIFQGWLQQAGVSTANFSPISTPFNANGAGIDGVLDQTSVSVNSTTGAISVVVSNSTITQNSTVTPSATAGSVSIATTQTTSNGSTSPLTTSTVVPTTTAMTTALDGIISTMNNLMSTVNQKGSSLQASDLALYVDPNLIDSGINASQFETQWASNLAGLTISFSGLQIDALDTTNHIANVRFNFNIQNGQSSSQSPTIDMVFKLISGKWLISGDDRIAAIYVRTDASLVYGKAIAFEVEDPQTDNVQSVIVSGPGLTGTVTIPVTCDNSGILSSTNCDTGNRLQRDFNYIFSNYWPPLPSTYTFKLMDKNGTQHTYNVTIKSALGFDASGNPVSADYPAITSLSPNSLTFQQILNSVTIHGSVYIPVWSTSQDVVFSYNAANSASNSVSNQEISSTWDSGYAVAGQVNNFTLTIPAATNVSTVTCPGGSGTCYNITFKGQTGTVTAEGHFEAKARYQTGGGAYSLISTYWQEP